MNDRPTLMVIQNELDQVLTAYREGKADEARKLLHATYMQRFEGIEGDLVEQDAELVGRHALILRRGLRYRVPDLRRIRAAGLVDREGGNHHLCRVAEAFRQAEPQ